MGEKPLEIRKIGQAETAVRGPRAHFVEQGMRGVDGIRIAQREKAETDPAAGLGYTQAGKMLQHLAEFKSLYRTAIHANSLPPGAASRGGASSGAP